MRALALAWTVSIFAGACQRTAKSSDGDHATSSQNREAIDRWRRPDALVAALGLDAGDSVCDAGAGVGYLTARLARAVAPGGRVIATDIDGAALAALAARARESDLQNVETRLVGPDDPGLPPGACDVVLLAQVDHLLPDRARWLRAARPSLRAGGRVAVSNREPLRGLATRAARDAGYSVREVDAGLPAQFLLLLSPQSDAPK